MDFRGRRPIAFVRTRLYLHQLLLVNNQ